MLKMNRFLILVSVLALWTAGCGDKKKSGGAGSAKSKSYPATAAGLKQQVGDVIAAIKKGDTATAKALCTEWRLPKFEAWFKETFGEARGGKLAKAYARQQQVIPEYPGVIDRQIKAGKTELVVTELSRATDLDARGLQSKAFKAMKKKVTLWDLRLVKPGKKLGYSIWSFVHVGGKFRLIGKLRGLNDKPPGKYGKIFDELPRRMVMEMLKKKG